MGKISKFLTFIAIALCWFMNLYPNQKEPIYIQYVDQIIDSFVKEIHKEYGLVCISTGGQLSQCVDTVSIGFTAYQAATVEEARRLEVILTEKLIKKINTHKNIRPYLGEYPFPSWRVEISVSFYTKSGSYYENSISFIYHVRKKIFYNIENPRTEKFHVFYEEPYEEALKIVQKEEKAKQEGKELEVIRNPIPIPHFPKDDGGFAAARKKKELYNTQAFNLLQLFLKKMLKEHGLRCFYSSFSEEMEKFMIGLRCDHPATLEEARRWTVIAIEEFLKFINEDKEIRSYLREYPFPLDKMEIAVCFFDRKDGSCYENSIIRTYQEKDQLFYILPSPTGDKKEVSSHQESYEEALKRVQTEK